jgi:hypothetical protein
MIKKYKHGFASVLLLGMLVLAIGASIFFRSQTGENPLFIQPSVTPTETPSDQAAEQNKLLLFDHGDFSFTYPNYQKYYQIGEHAFFWNSNSMPDTNDYPTMILEWSDKPFKEIKKGDFSFESPKYPEYKETISVDEIEKEEVSLGAKNTTLYSIYCGNDCYHHIVRFQSSGKYYQFVIDGAGGGIRLWVDAMLASFTFYEPSQRHTYTNAQGRYSLTYNSSHELYEDVGFSVDGVRYSAPNTITFTPGISLSFKELDKKIDLTEYVKENDQCATIDFPDKGIIDGEKAIVLGDYCGIVGSTKIYTTHKGLLYIFDDEFGNGIDFNSPIVKGFSFLD